MKSFFVRILISLLLGFVFIFFISKFVDLPKDVWGALSLGTVCALVHVISGFFTYFYAAKMNQNAFNKIFVASIAGRFLFLICLIALILKFSDVNMEVFLISFFIWYFVFQIWEVISLNKLLIKRV